MHKLIKELLDKTIGRKLAWRQASGGSCYFLDTDFGCVEIKCNSDARNETWYSCGLTHAGQTYRITSGDEVENLYRAIAGTYIPPIEQRVKKLVDLLRTM